VYQSEFNHTGGNAFQVLGNNFEGAVIPIWSLTTPATAYPPTEPFATEPIPRILLTRTKLAGEVAVNYNGIARSDYRVGYFSNGSPIDQSLDYNNSFGNGFLDSYYPSLQTSISRAKTIERSYDLSLLDIAQLNLQRLVYDDGAYFAINKVSNFLPGQKTNVELFKLL
jgi:hypothetical protein